MVHLYNRRKGREKFRTAPSGWQTYVSECASETARQLSLSKIPPSAIAGRTADLFKRLFPDNGYILLPAALTASPINDVSTKLMSDLVKYQLTHAALGQHSVWEEAFLLPSRPIPFLYAAYRRVCDLSADRMVFFLSKEEGQVDTTGHSGKVPSAATAAPEGLGLFTLNIGRMLRCLYALRPAFEARVREIRKYQTRVDRRERIHATMRRAIPRTDQTFGRKGLWIDPFRVFRARIKAWSEVTVLRRQNILPTIGRKTRGREKLVGSLIGITVVVCVVALVVFSGIDKILGLKRQPWSRQAERHQPPATRQGPEVDHISALQAPGRGDASTGSEHKAGKLEPRAEPQISETSPAEDRGRRPQKRKFEPPTVEASANDALRNGGHKGIRAVAGHDGSLTLIGSASSSREKRLAFKAVRSYAYAGRVRDLVYVVEE